MKYILPFVFVLTSCGFAKDTEDATTPSASDIIVKPFDGVSASPSQSDFAAMALNSNGGTQGAYGFDESNSGKRGTFTFDTTAKKLVFARSNASAGIWSDMTIYPPDVDGSLTYTMNQVKSISVVVKETTDGTDGESMCGLSLGFRSAAGNPNAAMSNSNLRLLGRDWSTSPNSDKTPRDFVRFLYETGVANEKLVIDSPINAFNAPNQWDNFTASEWYDADIALIPPGAELSHVNDVMTYRMTLDFDKSAHTVTIGLQTLSASVDTSTWPMTKKSIVWDYTAAVSNTVGGVKRGGLDLTNVTGSSSLALSALHDAPFAIGFVANQHPRGCEFSDLQITKAR